MRPEYLLIYEDKWKTWNKICVYSKISGKRGRKFVLFALKQLLQETLYIFTFAYPGHLETRRSLLRKE